jgi:hypothetical protein
MNSFTRLIAVFFLIAALSLVSCDNELNTLGNGIIGVDPNSTILQQEFEVTTFSSNLNPVQTDNFNSYLLGSYSDPVYGRSEYGLVTQLIPSFLNPNFDQDSDPGTLPVLESVFLEIPYFSTATDFDGEDTTYRIDSIYGGGASELKIYRNKFFLNDFDPSNPSQSATFFSDFKSDVVAASTGPDAELIYSNTAFVPLDQEIRVFNLEGDIIERKSPRLRVALDSPTQIAYWSEILFNSNPDDFRSNSNFKDFFRGLYISMTPLAPGSGSLIHLNLNDAAILFSVETPVEGFEEPITSSYRFDFSNPSVSRSIKVNFIEHDFPAAISTDIAASFNEDLGTENIYLKGGPGAMGFIDLFGPDADGDGEADALSEIIESGWLINDAILDVFVNQSIMQGGSSEPERLIIYNFETGRILADYIISTQSLQSPIDINTGHISRLEREDPEDSESPGNRYRIRLTNHVNAIVNGVIDNSRLAIAVTQNISFLGVNDVKSQTFPLDIETINAGSAISHEGTVLHGNRSLEIDKRPKFNIYYSQPTN